MATNLLTTFVQNNTPGSDDDAQNAATRASVVHGVITALSVNSLDPYPMVGCCGVSTAKKSAKARSSPSCITPFWIWFDEIRWQFNLKVLYHPFGALCKCNNKIGTKLARVTIADLLFMICVICFEIFVWTRSAEELNHDHDSEDSGDTIATSGSSDQLFQYSLLFARVSFSHFPIVLTLSQRNTFWNVIFGIPFERAIQYHIMIAKFALIFMWVHVILLFVHFQQKDLSVADELSVPKTMAGLIAWACIECGCLMAGKDSWRRDHWELFLKLHIFFVCAFVIFIWQHYVERILLIVPLVAWGIDLWWRWLMIWGPGQKAKVSNITYLPGDVIKIEWSQKNFKFDGGQWCFLCIPAIDITQFHPFSLSSGPNEDSLTFHIKVAGDWCERLKLLVTESNIRDWSQLQIFVEGPYGKPAIPQWKYNSLVLLSGGIGITPIKSVFSELMDLIKKNGVSDDNKSDVNVERIHFIWTLKTCDQIKEFDTAHNNVIKKYSQYEGKDNLRCAQEVTLNGKVVIKTSYYVTRCKDETEQAKWKAVYENVQFGRPDVNVIIQEAKESKGSECIGIMACGPEPMLETVRNVAGVNNIHCHTETFCF